MPQEVCGGFNVIPREKCFGLKRREWPLLFDENKTQGVIDRLNKSFIIHYWTPSKIKMSPSNVTNAFNVLGRTLCPKVMRHVGEFVT